MSYSKIAKAGTRFGHCVENCNHVDCKIQRKLAQTVCNSCGKPIGYETEYTKDINGDLIHFDCLMMEIERTKGENIKKEYKHEMITGETNKGMSKNTDEKSLWDILGHKKGYYTEQGQEQMLELANILEILSVSISKEQLMLFRELLASGHLHETLDILDYIAEGKNFNLK